MARLKPPRKGAREKAGESLLHRYSVVTAVHDCAIYLDQYFDSLTRDLTRFGSHIRVVVVDDGSSDDSNDVVRRWMNRFPDSVFLLQQSNEGASSARNAGINFVAERFPDTDWITFIDGDDFVDRNYFTRVDKFLSERPSDDVRMISCNFIPYDEVAGRSRDNHPLRYRFAARQTLRPMRKMGRWMQLSVNSAFFHYPTIRDASLFFDERIRPCFEDSHFVGRYMHFARNGSAAFLATPRYNYRKRQDRSSAMDGARASKRFYVDVLEHGCLDLIDFYDREAGGRLPTAIQRMILYHCCNYVSWGQLLSKPDVKVLRDPDVKARFITALERIFARIDDHVLHDFELASFGEFHATGVLACFKGRDAAQIQIEPMRFDKARQAIQLRYFVREVQDERFRIDNRLVRPLASKTIRHDFLDRPFVLERRIWLPVTPSPSRSQVLEAVIGDGRDTMFSIGNRPFVSKAPLAALIEHAKLHKERSTRSRIWLLMDRDTQADDNAEHFYRYVRDCDPDQPIRFVLAEESHDWERLKNDGFDLVAFGSHEHEYLLSVCDKIISSHADAYVFDYFRDGSTDNRHHVFLQHGVISADLSAWLNNKKLDCMVTTSPAEYDSICGEGSKYALTRREVVLSGLPRHDALIKRARQTVADKTVLVMPTWRASLVGRAGNGNGRAFQPGFEDSAFAARWRDLLCAPQLQALLAEEGYKLALFPHANLEPYLDLLDLPPGCLIYTHSDTSVQEALARASLLVTDYSSIAFDMALIDRPVVYYQFDRDGAFGGEHIYQPGYFDYERDGFGPVCFTADEAISELSTLIANDAKMPPVYRRRAAEALPFRDGDCSERVLKAIRSLDGTAGTTRLFALEDHPHVRVAGAGN